MVFPNLVGLLLLSGVIFSKRKADDG